MTTCEETKVRDTSFIDPVSMAECTIRAQAARQQAAEIQLEIDRAREIGNATRALHGRRLYALDELRKLRAWQQTEEARLKKEKEERGREAQEQREKAAAEKEARRKEFNDRHAQARARREEVRQKADALGINDFFMQIKEGMTGLRMVIERQASEIEDLRSQLSKQNEERHG